MFVSQCIDIADIEKDILCTLTTLSPIETTQILVAQEFFKSTYETIIGIGNYFSSSDLTDTNVHPYNFRSQGA